MDGTRSQVGRGRGARTSATAGSPEPYYLQDLTPPEHLPDAVKAVWREFAPKLDRCHLLTELDTFALEKLCVSVARYRRLTAASEEKMIQHNSETGAYSISPLVLLQQMYANQADGGMAKFGMNPADRARVMVNPQADLFPPAPGAQGADPQEGTARFFQH